MAGCFCIFGLVLFSSLCLYKQMSWFCWCFAIFPFLKRSLLERALVAASGCMNSMAWISCAGTMLVHIDFQLVHGIAMCSTILKLARVDYQHLSYEIRSSAEAVA